MFIGLLYSVLVLTFCTLIGIAAIFFVLGKQNRSLTWEDFFLSSFLVGTLVTTATVFGGSLFSIPIHFIFLLLLAGSFLFIIRTRNNFPQKPLPALHISSLSGLVAFAILLFISFRILVFSKMVSDGFVLWGLKSRVLNEERGVINSYFRDPVFRYSHLDYPFYLPVLETLVYKIEGRVDESHSVLIPSLFFILLLTSLYIFLRKKYSQSCTLWAVAVFSLTPIFREIAPLGYADVALALFAACCAMYFYQYMCTRIDTYKWISFLLASGLFWMKKEGIILTCIFLGNYVIFEKNRNWLFKLGILILLLSPFLMWSIFLWVQHVEGIDFSLFPLEVYKTRVVEILGFSRRLLKFTPQWGYFWIAYAGIIILSYKKIWKREFLFLLSNVLFPLGAYSLVFLFSTWDPYYEHFRTAFPRLVLQVFPIAYISAYYLLGTYVQWKGVEKNKRV